MIFDANLKIGVKVTGIKNKVSEKILPNKEVCVSKIGH